MLDGTIYFIEATLLLLYFAVYLVTTLFFSSHIAAAIVAVYTALGWPQPPQVQSRSSSSDLGCDPRAPLCERARGRANPHWNEVGSRATFLEPPRISHPLSRAEVPCAWPGLGLRLGLGLGLGLG